MSHRPQTWVSLDDAPGGLKVCNSRILGVGIDDSSARDVGMVDDKDDRGLTGAQGGDR